jgi:hypothetical protein
VWKVRRANSARGSIRKSNLRSRLQAAIADYESWRQDDCVQQPGTHFGTIRPLGSWPVAQPPQE